MTTTILDRPVTGPKVWTGGDFAGRTDWVWRLDTAQIAELDRLADAAAADTDDGSGDYPALDALLARVERELVDGRGFVMLRGVPVERYPGDRIERLYLRLGRRLGKPVSQNAFGDLLGHVRDDGKRVLRSQAELNGARGYRSNESLLFHSDLGDVVGLLCVQTAISGGTSTITSSMTVYNEILRRHPEYLEVYYRGFPFLYLEEGGDQAEWRLPIYSLHDGILSCAIRRNTIETARLNGLPFTPLELAALEFLDQIAAQSDLRFDMELERGDIQLLNNYTTLHSRTEFTDADEPERKRHLLRLWLQLPRGRSFLRVYPTIYDGIPKTAERAAAS